MAEFQTQVSFRIQTSEPQFTTDIKLELTYDDSNGQEGQIEIKASRGSTDIGRLKLRVNPVTHMLVVDPGSVLATPEAQCIAQCLGIAVGKGLIECLLGLPRRMLK
jgi:hypothetical protein